MIEQDQNSAVFVVISLCNRHYDLLMISMNLSKITVLNIKGSHYCCINYLISKNEAVKSMENADLTEKK